MKDKINIIKSLNMSKRVIGVQLRDSFYKSVTSRWKLMINVYADDYAELG